jgi:hypothetical protein
MNILMTPTNPIRNLIRTVLVLTCIIPALTLTGCGGGGGGGGGGAGGGTGLDAVVEGSWAGIVESTVFGNGLVTIDLVTTPIPRSLEEMSAARGVYVPQLTVTGRWWVDFDGPRHDFGGTVTGISQGGSVTGSFVSDFPLFDETRGSFSACDRQFELIVSNDSASGFFFTNQCVLNNNEFEDDDGIVSMTRVADLDIIDLTGLYTGTVNSNIAGDGVMALSVLSSGVNLIGIYSITYETDPLAQNSSGDVWGYTDGDLIFMRFDPTTGNDCFITSIGTTNGTIIGSGFDYFSCNQVNSGGFDLMKSVR